MTFFGIPFAVFAGQMLIGLINGAFYALLTLGIAIIFGLLRIANFVHGAQYMLGAFAAWFLLGLDEWLPGIPVQSYWVALILAPLAVGVFGVVLERFFLRSIYKLDHAYGLLLTIGLAYIIEGVFRVRYGTLGVPYPMPTAFSGGFHLGFMYLPAYRLWVICASLVVCVTTWLVIERSQIGSHLRAATENPIIAQALGINVPRLLTLTYGFGVALAGLAGVMAAPIYQVSPLMGHNIIITIFAVVVIGGMGSIGGAIVAGFGLGLVEGIARVFWPEASGTVIFVIMAVVLLVRPAGLFGRAY